MRSSAISFQVDERIAKIYQEAPEDVQKKMQILFDILMQELILSPRPLQDVMDEISQKAEERGLTPEILDSLLNAER